MNTPSIGTTCYILSSRRGHITAIKATVTGMAKTTIKVMTPSMTERTFNQKSLLGPSGWHFPWLDFDLTAVEQRLAAQNRSQEINNKAHQIIATINHNYRCGDGRYRANTAELESILNNIHAMVKHLEVCSK